MYANPLVSVVLPTYNRGSTIKSAISNILQQSFNAFELIIVDDGSTDNTAAVINDISDRRIRFLRLEKNSGPAAARNRGIEAARAKYIAFQDSDDLWHPEMLEECYHAMEHSSDDVGLVYTDWLIVPGNYLGSLSISRTSASSVETQSLLYNAIFPNHGFVKTDVFKKIENFDTTLPIREDTELWLRMAKNFKFKHIPKTLGIYRIHPGGVSRNTNLRKQATINIYKKHKKTIDSAYQNEETLILDKLQKKLAERMLFIWGTGSAGERALHLLEKWNFEVEGFFESSIHERKTTKRYRNKKVYGPIHLLTKKWKQSPFILVESVYIGQIETLLKSSNLQPGEDYELNLLSPLNEIKPL
ncbi:MAG: glycosyltransferase family 2 protein [bacterium]